ncbi:MAG: PPC domain-containing protein [Candidatus Promineofilum sp.]|nr:PPC domain-containing protein [Promineifilum sp.]MCW5865391.1 PPC domain-containing protein [Anaerolineae bacterium]
MQKRDLRPLALGILITAVAACRTTPTLPTDAGPAVLEPEWVEPTVNPTPADFAPAAVSSPLETSPPVFVSSPAAPATTEDGRLLGSDRAGLSLRIPADWIDLTAQSNIPAMGNRLGINLVFAADSERTGRSLLAGKAFARGAYVSGLLVAPGAATADPAAALTDLLRAAAPTAVPLTAPADVVSANGVAGIALEVADGPIGVNAAATELRTRVVLYRPEADSASPSWVVLLLSASTSRWPAVAPLFDAMLASVRVGAGGPGAVAQAGRIVVRGQLAGEGDSAGATLEPAVSDLWTFAAAANQYVSLALAATEPQLDLALTLLGPDRQTIARVDNGYAGAMETVTDLLLAQPGAYIVEVSDFYGAAGGYTLSLVLSAQPQFSAGGPIAVGQALQGELPANGRHYWVFQGTAGQHINVVVEPEAATVDAIIDVYGPDGQRLAAYDEGFSGDPEIITGLELPATGEYAILVRSFAPRGGPYTISLDEGKQTIANYHDAGDLAYGDVRAETLQPHEAHAWFVQGRGGDHILIRVTPLSPSLDLDVWLLDSAIERVAAVDAFAAGEPETIELTLAADGQYIVLVRDFNGEPGDYEIALGAAPVATPAHAGALNIGDTIIGVIPPGAAVAWSFEAAAGEAINVTVTPAEAGSDIVLQLQGPDGLTALEVDAGSAGAAESVTGFVVPATGAWRIVLREYFAQTANFRLSLTR